MSFRVAGAERSESPANVHLPSLAVGSLRFTHGCHASHAEGGRGMLVRRRHLACFSRPRTAARSMAPDKPKTARYAALVHFDFRLSTFDFFPSRDSTPFAAASSPQVYSVSPAEALQG